MKSFITLGLNFLKVIIWLQLNDNVTGIISTGNCIIKKINSDFGSLKKVGAPRLLKPLNQNHFINVISLTCNMLELIFNTAATF